jgi:hypothetical protein
MYEYIKVYGQILVYSHARILIYKTFARPVISYGSESWTIGGSGDERRLMSAEMCFLRTVGYSCSDRRRKEQIMRVLRIPQITELTE